MVKLPDEALKQVVGGNVDIAGNSYSAQDIINMWKSQKTFCKTMFAMYGSSNPEVIEAIKAELNNSGLSIPSDLKSTLGM